MSSIYNASANIVKSSLVHFSASDISLNKNNVLARLNVISPGTKLDTMNSFLLHCPLHDAMTLTPSYLYHTYLCEFWYTAEVQLNDSINFTLKNGSVCCTLDLSLFRDSLNLNYLKEGEEFATLPPSVNLRDVFAYCGHPNIRNPNGSVKTSGTVHLSGLTTTWRYLFSHIVECVGGKSGGLDQVNEMEMKIGYCLYKGLKVDYAKIIFDNLLQKLKVIKRSPYVPYLRFLSLCFKNILKEDFDDEALEKSDPEWIKDFSTLVCYDTEVPISEEMQQVIPLAQRNKTGATKPVEPESASGGLQKNEGPTERTRTKRVTKPVLIVQPIRSVSPTLPETEDLSKDLPVIPLGRKRRLRKLSDMPTDTSIPTKPSDVSQQTSDMSKGTQQTSLLESSLGMEG